MAHLRIIVALVALAMLAPAASAQAVPTDPKVAVTLAATPATTPTVALGSSAAFNITITVDTTNIVCQGDASIPVGLTASTGLTGMTTDLPASVSVTVPKNFPPTGASISGKGTATATFTVTIAKTALGDHEHKFTINGTYAGGTPTGCNLLSPNTVAAATGSTSVSVKTGPAPVVATGTGTSGAATGTGVVSGSGTTTKKSFFLPLQVELGVLVLLGLAGRRFGK